jgi:formylmethanofuran dehydrogenase subunit E
MSDAPSLTNHHGNTQPQTRQEHTCDLCGEPIPPREFDPETLRATGFAVCGRCIEDTISDGN